MISNVGYLIEFVTRFAFSFTKIRWCMSSPTLKGEFGIWLWLKKNYATSYASLANSKFLNSNQAGEEQISSQPLNTMSDIQLTEIAVKLSHAFDAIIDISAIHFHKSAPGGYLEPKSGFIYWSQHLSN